MTNPPSQIVGYCAQASPTELFLNGDAALIASSPEAMQQYLVAFGMELRPSVQIREVSFAQILDALYRRGAYCFDRVCYDRFLPFAQAEGLPLSVTRYPDPSPADSSFVRVELGEAT